MNRSSILKGFNNHLMEFIDDIIFIFPQQKNLKITKMALETWKKMNPKSLILTWKVCIYEKYNDKIKEGNIDFFIDKNYIEDISGCESDTYILKAIEKLREPIRLMGGKNKNKTLKYIQNLTKLCELYYSS